MYALFSFDSGKDRYEFIDIFKDLNTAISYVKENPLQMYQLFQFREENRLCIYYVDGKIFIQ